jgi:hypothetical protein
MARLSPHAEERIGQRQIDPRELEQALRFGRRRHERGTRQRVQFGRVVAIVDLMVGRDFVVTAWQR